VRKQAWLPGIPFFIEEEQGAKDDDKGQTKSAKNRSYKINFRPGIDEEDSYHYTVAIGEFEYTSSEKDPEAWWEWRLSMTGLFNSLGVADESIDEMKNLYYSNPSLSAQGDWQRFATARFAPEALEVLYPDDEDSSAV
jgi:hypothetical protein